MTALVFVDANVLLYARDKDEPTKQPRAQEWLERLWREGRGRISAQVLSEYYVNARRADSQLSDDEAWEDVRMYLAWQPEPIDQEVLMRGREVEKRYKLSWWDSLIVAAAQLQECRVLLTEDLQDGMTFGTVKVRNPFLHAVEEPAAEYAMAPLHRPRGRPRRVIQAA